MRTIRKKDLLEMGWSEEMYDTLILATKGRLKDPALFNFIYEEFELANSIDRYGYPYGIVYVVTDGTGCYKVGKSKDQSIIGRLSSLQVGNPRELSYTNCYFCSNYNLLEVATHSILEEHRIIGEWFNAGLTNIQSAVKKAALENNITIYGDIGVDRFTMSRNMIKMRDQYVMNPKERYCLFLKNKEAVICNKLKSI